GGSGHSGQGFYWHTMTNGGDSPALNPSPPLFNQLDDIHVRVSGRGAVYSAYFDGSTTPATTLTLPPPPTRNVGLYDFTASPVQDFDNFVLSVPCYANCDQSTTVPVLNVADFSCFLNAFAAGNLYANCDGSTTSPVLNVGDFSCFLNRFAAGC